jgi:DNA polymerase III alpha subunit
MKVDSFGQFIYNESDICSLYLENFSKKIRYLFTETNIELHDIIDTSDVPKFILYEPTDVSIQEFDESAQHKWFMPNEYIEFDIAKYVLDLCDTDEELQRVGQELLLFQQREMFPLLRYLKYLVDTLRKHNIVWGVGRGSSVASYVLFLIGIHRINSLYYELCIDEFLK